MHSQYCEGPVTVQYSTVLRQQEETCCKEFCTVLWCITDRPFSSNHSNYRATVPDMLHEPGRAGLTNDSVNTYLSDRKTFEIEAAEENEM